MSSRRAQAVLSTVLAALFGGSIVAGCHPFHSRGKLPGGSERIALTIRERGWTVEVKLESSGDHSPGGPFFNSGPTDWWRLEHGLILTPPSGGARAVGELWYERAAARRDARNEIEDAFTNTRVVGCSDKEGRVLVRVDAPPSESIVAEASFWRGIYLLPTTALVLPSRLAGVDCAAALAAMPKVSAWLEDSLRSERAVPRTETFLGVRDGDPVPPERRVEPFQTQMPFVMAAREKLATGAALDHVFDSVDLVRSSGDFGAEIAALAATIAADASFDEQLSQRLLPGRRNNGSQWAETGGQGEKYALDEMVRTIVAALPAPRRARLVETVAAPWLLPTGTPSRESRDLWKLRTVAALVAEAGARDVCDRLLARMPALMAEAGDWHEHYATAALRDLPRCASPELVRTTARAILVPSSPALTVARDYHAVSHTPCRLDAPEAARVGCRSAPFRAAQILQGSCDEPSLSAARAARASAFFSAKAAGECLLARCEKRPVAPQSSELLFVDICREP